VTASTWPRDSHGLYDYETTSAVRCTFPVTQVGQIVRVGNECSFVTKPTLGSVPLAEVFDHKGKE
jgi:hypothetical protein